MNKLWTFTSVAKNVNRFRNIWQFLLTDNFGLFSKHFFGPLDWVYWTNIFTWSESVQCSAIIYVKKRKHLWGKISAKIDFESILLHFSWLEWPQLGLSFETLQPTRWPLTKLSWHGFHSDPFVGIHKGRPRQGGRGVSQKWTSWEKGKGVLAKKDVPF